jgi:Snf7
MFGGLFALEAPKPKSSDAMIAANEGMKKLRTREIEVKTRIAQLGAYAKSHAMQGRNDEAVSFLKRRRVFVDAHAKISTAKENLNAMMDAVELAEINFEAVSALKNANDALKSALRGMTVDDVEKVMEESFELTADVNDLSEVLSRDPSDYDCGTTDEELERELAELMRGDSMRGDSIPLSPTTFPEENEIEGYETKVSREERGDGEREANAAFPSA